MDYLVFVGLLGAGGVIFLWLRDARIFFRTGLPGYRKGAWWGIGYGALAILGAAFTLAGLMLLGLGIILAAFYLQGRITREKIWKDEGTLDRFLGSVPVSRANKK